MDWQLIIDCGCILGLVVILLNCTRWLGRIEKSTSYIVSSNEKIEEINNAFRSEINKTIDKVDARLKSIEERLCGMEATLRSIDFRIYTLEGKDEEKFRNEIRMIAGKLNE